jgi:hypothetical protein
MNDMPFDHQEIEALGRELIDKIEQCPVHERNVELTVRRRLLARITDNDVGRWEWMLSGPRGGTEAAEAEYQTLTDSEKLDLGTEAMKEIAGSYIATIDGMFATCHALGIHPKTLIANPNFVALAAATFRPTMPDEVDDWQQAA